MSGKYLLDTNIVIALFAEDASVQRHIAASDKKSLFRGRDITETDLWVKGNVSAGYGGWGKALSECRTGLNAVIVSGAPIPPGKLENSGNLGKGTR